MSETIRGRIFACREGDIERIQDYFSRQGMTFNNGLDDAVFFIELKQRPDALVKLEAAGFFQQDKIDEWSIMSITEQGITLYYAHQRAGDGYIFIPQANVVAIHTVDKECLDAIRN